MERQIFKRYETKYLLEESQYEWLRERLRPFLREDTYGETDICNCYYDTPDFQMIRNSLEKPAYKEKLRLRSYGRPEQEEAQVYLELKKKFQGVVYKRRESLPLAEAEAYLNERKRSERDSQILREIDWALQYYRCLAPRMYLAYQRTALYEREEFRQDTVSRDVWEEKREEGEEMTHSGNLDLRITFDRNILWRTEEVNLEAGIYGNALLLPGQRVMEVKAPGAMPIWLANFLDEMQVYPVSFSKYGRAYEEKNCMQAKAM